MVQKNQKIRTTAENAMQKQKYRKALQAYLQLEDLEPRDPQWPRRVSTCFRFLGQYEEANAANLRAARRYADAGFFNKALAMCNVALTAIPDDADAQELQDELFQKTGMAPNLVPAGSGTFPTLPTLAARRGGGTSTNPINMKSTVSLRAGLDPTRTTGLTAEEAFVLSRLDNPLQIGELVSICPMPGQQVLEIVSKQVANGVLTVLDGTRTRTARGTQQRRD